MHTFSENIIQLYGKAGEIWLKQLPDIISLLTHHWQLENLCPVDNMSYHFVAKAIKQKQPVILKIGYDRKTIAKEKQALIYFVGSKIIKLLDSHEKQHALLLQQALPGTELKSLYPAQLELVIDKYCEVMQSLHQKTLPKELSFLLIADWLKDIDNYHGKRIPKKLIDKAISIKSELLKTLTHPVLLHGDLHQANILKNGNEWIAIDPKGIIGEAEFEAAAFDFIHASEFNDPKKLQNRFAERTTLLAQKAHLDVKRLRGWIFVRLILMALWFEEDHIDTTWPIHLAMTIKI